MIVFHPQFHIRASSLPIDQFPFSPFGHWLLGKSSLAIFTNGCWPFSYQLKAITILKSHHDVHFSPYPERHCCRYSHRWRCWRHDAGWCKYAGLLPGAILQRLRASDCWFRLRWLAVLQPKQRKLGRRHWRQQMLPTDVLQWRRLLGVQRRCLQLAVLCSMSSLVSNDDIVWLYLDMDRVGHGRNDKLRGCDVNYSRLEIQTFLINILDDVDDSRFLSFSFFAH